MVKKMLRILLTSVLWIGGLTLLVKFYWTIIKTLWSL